MSEREIETLIEYQQYIVDTAKGAIKKLRAMLELETVEDGAPLPTASIKNATPKIEKGDKIYGEVCVEREKAICILTDTMGTMGYWVPKSAISARVDHDTGQTTLTVKDWFIRKMDLKNVSRWLE